VTVGGHDVLVHNVKPLRCQSPEELDKKIDDKQKSPNPDDQLEGQLGKALRDCLTQFDLPFDAAPPHNAGQIDAGTDGAIIEVYNGTKHDLDGKSGQMTKYKEHPDVNPGGKRQVFVLAPNVSELDRARFAKDNGVRVFGSIDHLRNHLRRNGLC
jgi:hypothetical protein